MSDQHAAYEIQEGGGESDQNAGCTHHRKYRSGQHAAAQYLKYRGGGSLTSMRATHATCLADSIIMMLSNVSQKTRDFGDLSFHCWAPS